jgi:SAM-dependent methyltransferase
MSSLRGAALRCRFCKAPVSRSFVDLGMQPLSNAYVDRVSADRMEPFYPLHAYVCEACLLVQVPELQSPERIFTDYAYLSSMSDSWLEHNEQHALRMIDMLHLGTHSLVVEVASNDGYLLRNFKEKGIPVLGIEPAANVAVIAEAAGVRTLAKFFGTKLAAELAEGGQRADLLVGNNVLAHVPDLNDFVRGLAVILAPRGVLTMEFPHLGRLLKEKQFDTIYHEHFSYFSFGTVERVFAAHDLKLFDVEELPTHGGSLRIYACHADRPERHISPHVQELREREQAEGGVSLEAYAHFAEDVREVKLKLLEFLIGRKREGKTIVAYGAAAKGNTLLNYCGIREDFIDYVVDRSRFKQGKLLPGSRIPIEAPERIRETRPDYVLVLPWNLKEEISAQLSFVREWGGQLVVPIPTVSILP